EVIHQHHPVALPNGVDMHLHLVGSIFERVGHPHGLMWQLAFLADRHETGRDLMRYRAAQDEPTRLNACNPVDLASRPGLHQLIDRAAEGTSIAEKRGNVAKHDAGLGIVRNRANGGFQVVLEDWRRHGITKDRTRLTGSAAWQANKR